MTFAGVGKTVIAAFDYKRFKQANPRASLLFVAHRKEILEQSIKTFQEILNDFNFGDLYVDGRKPNNIEHLFVSIQSLNSAKLDERMSEDYYDYICVDEFHHAAADSYQELLSHFHPKILLGLTATPDRMDGKDILKHFDGRIASKMLLGEAIDRNLLSTFQYYGITDDVDYRKLNWTRGRYDTKELEKIYTADRKRCSLILESVNKYVADMNEVKGLGFCVSVDHADYMADYFNRNGVPSISLSAKSMRIMRSMRIFSTGRARARIGKPALRSRDIYTIKKQVIMSLSLLGNTRGLELILRPIHSWEMPIMKAMRMSVRSASSGGFMRQFPRSFCPRPIRA